MESEGLDCRVDVALQGWEWKQVPCPNGGLRQAYVSTTPGDKISFEVRISPKVGIGRQLNWVLRLLHEA